MDVTKRLNFHSKHSYEALMCLALHSALRYKAELLFLQQMSSSLCGWDFHDTKDQGKTFTVQLTNYDAS